MTAMARASVRHGAGSAGRRTSNAGMERCRTAPSCSVFLSPLLGKEARSIEGNRIMARRFILAALIALAPLPAFAQAQTDTLTPTIPESQIEAAKLSSTYEFLSVSTSIDDFEAKSAVLAGRLAESADVKAFAAGMAADHVAMAEAALAAGKGDKVEIATPSVDGEQQGLLTKLEGLKGAEFDRSYIESQIYVHQRAIAIYKGYAGRQDNLGRFAAATLPKVVEHYSAVLGMAEKFGLTQAAQEPAAQQ